MESMESIAPGTRVFVKQLGSRPVVDEGPHRPIKLKDPKGGELSEWPEDLRVRQWPREVASP